ncbi:hypothetical protein DRQ21_03225 [Candidatus Fermentibacteria bacterium]|nr:MAG: hypothetical protein DRQ21_03225 [Candidatus Fermentibacteria bacterium]
MKTEITSTERVSRMILALLVGTLIWGAAIDSEIFFVEVRLPLYLDIEEDFTVSDVGEDSVTVRLAGSGLDMLKYQIGSPLTLVRRTVQTGGYSSFPADGIIEMSVSDIHPQGPVTVSRVVPDLVSFTIDTVISRELPVSVLSTDAVPGRFRLLSVEPVSITVTGPSSLVLHMDSVVTEPVDISSGHATASLASIDDMVAYSEGSVDIQAFVPEVPVVGAVAGQAGY